METKIALCCIGRLENQYAKEYVNHYRKLGFDKIILCDNNYDGEEHFEEVLENDINNGFVDILDYRNKKVAQIIAYIECYNRYKNEYDWIAFFDMDEFLIINDGSDIHTFMERFNGFQCLFLNWMIMTDNGHVYNSHEPLMERFTTPMDLDKKVQYNFPENNHVKSIVKGGLEIINFANPHVPTIPMNCCNAKGEKVDQKPWTPYDHSVAYLKHFTMKTLEEWINNKRKKGTPDREYKFFIANNNYDKFFYINEKTQEKLDYIAKIEKEQS